MSSDAAAPTPRTAVPLDIVDPVARARAELAAALAAIEEKANVPKRVARATGRGIADARVFARRNPAAAALAVVGVAVVAGGVVWAMVRLYTR